jgi:hypothetical protein
MSVNLARLLREVSILFVCLALFPLVVLLALIYTDSLQLGLTYLSRELFSDGIGLGRGSLSLCVKWLTPYLVVQAIRSFLWAQRSVTGRKWGNLYFSALSALVAGWSFLEAWDFFYFMYRLGGIPRDLMQFFEVQYENIVVFIVFAAISLYCFSIFLSPEKRRPTERVEDNPPENHLS